MDDLLDARDLPYHDFAALAALSGSRMVASDGRQLAITCLHLVEVRIGRADRWPDSRNNPDGPAVILCDGTREWWLDDLPHRRGGPAVESADGTLEWWSLGNRHRTDGPDEYWVGGFRVAPDDVRLRLQGTR